MTGMLRAQFTLFGLKHGLAGVLGVFQNPALRRYYAAKGLDVYEQVQRLKQGNHLSGMDHRAAERLASKLHDALTHVSTALSHTKQTRGGSGEESGSACMGALQESKGGGGEERGEGRGGWQGKQHH